MSPEEYGMLTVKVRGKSDTSRYILQLLDSKSSLLQEKKDVVTGTYVFRYIKPGEVILRVVEDMNGNGQWDTGDLLLHRQPERVEVYIPESGNELIALKANWEIELAVDMDKLFRPVDINDIRQQLRKQEIVRAQRLMEERIEKAKKQQQQQQNSTRTNSSNAFNPTGGFGTGGMF